MSSSVTYHFPTTASTNLQPLGSADQGGTVKGYTFNNAAGANAAAGAVVTLLVE